MSKRNVVHIEIPTSDVPGSSQFYERLFGWKMQHDAAFDYTMWADGGGSGGGFTRVEGSNPNQVLVYIASDDIETDLQQAVRLGGSVVTPKTEIPGNGWFGLFKDPAGNTLALYTSLHAHEG